MSQFFKFKNDDQQKYDFENLLFLYENIVVIVTLGDSPFIAIRF